ncbi:hypothetical protein Taro_011897 [Colocasia esculenta]|uniref:BRX domain-containing protein n=1 Tax=Colocasia esculenta TaxID=4460 RepID=A0A843UE12_COLES|nr:hypothetical protein [Colocasia esculenta]
MEAMPSQRHTQLDHPIQASGLGLDPAPEVTDEMAEQIKRLKKNRKKQQQQQRQQKAIGGGGGRQHRYVVEGHGGRLEVDKGAGGEPNEEEEEECWVAEVDRGVLITFVSLAGGQNAIVKIRFREDMFDASEAQKWWIDNYERILNLYSVRRRDASPVQSDDETPGTSVQESSHTQTTNNSDYNSAVSSSTSHAHHKTSAGGHEERVAITGKLVEWVVEDQPGVFITIRSLSDGTKQIRRVELSREKFGEVKARVWWEENKGRLYQQYT